MKLMKHILIALVLCAIPALAFAQTVSCDKCSHELPYYKGEGGFIAVAKDGETMVTWHAVCSGVTRTGMLEPNAEGGVAMLFNDENNLNCSADNGRFRLGEIKDGGWYWITDDKNTAVGNIVNDDIRDNTKIELVNPGAGVVMTDRERGAVFLKETSTGRVGILPNILPVPPPTPETLCGFKGRANITHSDTGKSVVKKDCVLGDGKTVVVLSTTVGRTGASGDVAGGTVVRRYSGNVVITPRLYGNGTGHYNNATPAATNAGDPDLGQAGGSPFVFTGSSAWSAMIDIAPPGSDLAIGATDRASSHGVALANNGVITVSPNTTYCGRAANPKSNPMKIKVKATLAGADLTQVTPSLAATAEATFTINCPTTGASVNEGVDLVPDLFPTD